MVLKALKADFPVAAGSGNSGDSSRAYSPGRVKPVLTIGAIAKNYEIWAKSCRGLGVDLLAPGVNLLSTWITSDSLTNVLSGTSIPAPHWPA